MKNNTLAVVAFLALALGLSSSLTASDLREMLIDISPTVVIDNGVIYGISKNATLRSDLATGRLEIHYADGTRFVSESATVARSDDLLLHWPEPITIHVQYSAEDGDFGLMAVCQSEANALAHAIGAAQEICKGDNPQACQNALLVVDDAHYAYQDCMRQFLQMH